LNKGNKLKEEVIDQRDATDDSYEKLKYVNRKTIIK
jgi:hypothetical protein